jgi:hypothetical protein
MALPQIAQAHEKAVAGRPCWCLPRHRLLCDPRLHSPSGSRHTMKGSAVVLIGVGRGGVSRDNGIVGSSLGGLGGAGIVPTVRGYGCACPTPQISRCCLRASHTPSTTWAAPRILIRSGCSTNHSATLRVLSGPTTHSRECSLGARNSMSPSPSVTIAKA